MGAALSADRRRHGELSGLSPSAARARSAAAHDGALRVSAARDGRRGRSGAPPADGRRDAAGSDALPAAAGPRIGARWRGGGVSMTPPRHARELSRREFLAVAGAAAALPLVDRTGPRAVEPKRIRIKSVALDFEREPLIRPTGFKGGFLTEL